MILGDLDELISMLSSQRSVARSAFFLFLCLTVLYGCDSTSLNDETEEIEVASSSDEQSQQEALPMEGDRIQIKAGGADVYNGPNRDIVDFAPELTTGVALRIKEGWAKIQFDEPFQGKFILADRMELEGGGGGNADPTASFTFSVNELEVTFTDTSTDADGSIVAWSWNFGDGNSSSSQHPIHTYGSAQTYTVSLEVTDNDGGTDQVMQDVVVSGGGGGENYHIVMIGCSNTDDILANWNSATITANPAGGQSGKTIVRYGEYRETKKFWDKFKVDVESAGTNLDLAIYMVCQRYDPTGRRGARLIDADYGLPPVDSGSPNYGEKDLLKNILGEMRQILNDRGLSSVPVAAMPMHFYEPHEGNTNPCERIGENGILAQWSYVDDVNDDGPQSSLLRPELTFVPTPLVNADGSAWRMPSVFQQVDTVQDMCHLNQSYVQNKFIPSFEAMMANL